MRKQFALLLILVFIISGCSSSDKSSVEKFIQEAFKIRANAVFLYKDKKVLAKYFSARALDQSKAYLNWRPSKQWNNVKNLKYSITLRIEDIKTDGKQATATVLETVVVTWDYIDPSKVMGADYIKEDAWSNRRHLVTLVSNPEGNWIIDQDVVEK
jgi:hypothetical protein